MGRGGGCIQRSSPLSRERGRRRSGPPPAALSIAAPVAARSPCRLPSAADMFGGGQTVGCHQPAGSAEDSRLGCCCPDACDCWPPSADHVLPQIGARLPAWTATPAASVRCCGPPPTHRVRPDSRVPAVEHCRAAGCPPSGVRRRVSAADPAAVCGCPPLLQKAVAWPASAAGVQPPPPLSGDLLAEPVAELGAQVGHGRPFQGQALLVGQPAKL